MRGSDASLWVVMLSDMPGGGSVAFWRLGDGGTGHASSNDGVMEFELRALDDGDMDERR